MRPPLEYNLAMTSGEIMKWIKYFYDLCTELAQKRWALPLLGLFSFLESIIVPIPADPLLIAICAARPKASIRAFLWTLAGSISGACVGYFLGLHFSATMQAFILDHFLTLEQWSWLAEHFTKGTFIFVFVGGFTPLPFKVFAITAGLLNGAFLPFFLGALLGRGLRFGVIAGLFYFYGQSIKAWIESHFEKVIWGLTLVIILCSILYFVLTK